MNATDPTPLSPQARADLIAVARARAVSLRAQAKAEFAKKMITGAMGHIRRISKFLAQTLAQARSENTGHRHTGTKG
jgi:hypothetical protein